MDWLIEPFETAVRQRALVGGVLAALAASVVGAWVILRGMTFLGDALAHGVIPGIAVAILLEFNLALGAVLAAAAMVAGINLVHRQTAFSEDTGIGLLFVGMLGLGVMVVSGSEERAEQLTDLLFGDPTSVTGGDIAFIAVVAAVTLAASLALYRQFLVLAFNEQKAELLGLRPGLAHVALLSLLTLAIVSSFQTVGTLLVFGLIVGPPATAALLVRRVPTMMATSALIGMASVVAGLVISFHADISGSATMAVVPIVLFFAVLTTKSVLGRRRRSASPVEAP